MQNLAMETVDVSEIRSRLGVTPMAVIFLMCLLFNTMIWEEAVG